MSLPKYGEYKESSVEWIGEIPSHWSIKPIKRGFSVVGGSTPKSDEAAYWDGEIVWVSPADLSKLPSLYISDSNRKITPEGLSSCGTTLVPSNSIVLSTRAPIGSLAIAATTLCTNQGCKSLVPKDEVVSRYFVYVLISATTPLNLRGKGTTFLELSADELSAFSVPYPSKNEQVEIANFLDRETAKIDTLIAEQENLIALLAEKRQATISHAVTRGLNPDVPMKDSGVAWLGEVPAHWEVKSFRHILDAIGDVDHFMPASVERGVPYLMTGDLKDFLSQVRLDDCKQVSRHDYLQLSKRIKSSKGDVVMARYATIGTSMYVDVDVEFLVSYSCVTLKVNSSKMCGFYFFHYMGSEAFRQEVENRVNTNTQANVGIKDLQGVKIPVPPVDEQVIIANHLSSEIKKLDLLDAESERAIALLKERRSALIAAAVTGQIDVRNA